MFCAYTRPRYQVSVYRTIRPLVSNGDPELTLTYFIARLYMGKNVTMMDSLEIIAACDLEVD